MQIYASVLKSETSFLECDTVSSITPRPSPIPEGGLAIPVIMHFVHQSKLILQKMKTFVDKRVKEMTELSRFEEIEKEIEEAEKEEEIEMIVESGDESDYVKDCENCIGSEDTQTCTELILIND